MDQEDDNSVDVDTFLQNHRRIVVEDSDISDQSDIEIPEAESSNGEKSLEMSQVSQGDVGMQLTFRLKTLTGPAHSTTSQSSHLSKKLEQFYRKTRILQPKTPLDYFHLFMEPSLLDAMVRNTNSYVRWKMAKTAAKKCLEHYIDPRWQEIDSNEIRAFVCMNIFMGISQLTRYEMYWSRDLFIGNTGFQNTVTQNRYEMLQEYFHISDREQEPAKGSPEYDRLYKIKPVLKHVTANFAEMYQAHKNQSIDEAMVAMAT